MGVIRLRGRPVSPAAILALWFVLTVASGISGAILLEVPKYYQLTKRGVATTGRITELQPLNHRAVVYGYQTGPGSFSGAGHAGDIDAKFHDLKPGESVIVFYDPLAPDISCLGEPRRHLNSLLRGSAFIAAIPTLGLISIELRAFIRTAPQR